MRIRIFIFSTVWGVPGSRGTGRRGVGVNFNTDLLKNKVAKIYILNKLFSERKIVM
jgi:hypothetical protein